MKKKEKAGNYQGSYKVAGGRYGVLLIHSLGGTPVELRHLAQSLGRSGFTVSCPFVPGMTAGTDISGISTWEDWFAGIEASYAELAETCDTIYVGGLSAGSILGLHLATKHPETIGGLILLAPTLWPNGWAIPWYFNFFRLVNDRFSARLFHFRQREPFGIKDERIRKFAIESFANDERPVEDIFGRGGGLVYQFRRLVRRVQRQLGEINQPALVIHPRQDDQSDLSNAFRIQRGLAGMVESIVLNDSYHMVTLDRQRNLVVDRTVEFLERLAAADEAKAARTVNAQKYAANGAAE
ncbi:MAG: alpha/beta fold hydrolase [Hyphomicrobiaceae bacterium]|nr:alpha/beta fold hydrolase [Hyphomicrobiaceae bacterium]